MTLHLKTLYKELVLQLSEEKHLAKYAFIKDRLTRFPFLGTTLQPRILKVLPLC